MTQKKLTEEEKHQQRMILFKSILKQGIVFYGLSLILVTVLMFLHYPPVYFTGTTFEALQFYIESERYEQIGTFVFLIFTWSLLMTPLMVLFKGKYFGKIMLAIFSFMMGLEKYVFYIQGENTPWNSAFSRDTLETFLSEATIGGIKDAYTSYGQDIHFLLYLVVFPIGVFIFTILLLKLAKPVKSWISNSSLFLFLFFLTAFPNEVDAPYIYKVPLVLENYVSDSIMERALNVKRHEIFFNEVNKTKKKPENIVFIMDESIRGDLISVNNPNEEEVMRTTPFLYSIKDKLINFGVNYSMGNCSQISNMLFISGFKNTQALKVQPMIFQYMKNAGYETYLLDSPHNRLLDGFFYYDKEHIDHYISLRDNKKMERDTKGLDKLKEILNKPGKKFIYLLKQGAHFPFEENFKKENAVLPFNKKTERGYLNLYLNALKVAVDDYWKKLIKVIDDKDAVVLWQGDHGVNIVPNKGDKYVKLTHCEVGLTYRNELYNVAAMMYSPKKEYYKGFKNLENGYSNIHMLPTLLDFAGYNIEDIKNNYSTTYKNPDKNISIFTQTNWGENPILPINIVKWKDIEKNGIEKGAIDTEIKQSELNKRRKL